MSRRTETAYKAQSPGKLALFDFAQGMVSLSNHVAKVHPVEFPRGNPIQRGEHPYPGRSARLAVAPCGSALCSNMQGDRHKSAACDELSRVEVIVGEGRRHIAVLCHTINAFLNLL